MLTQYFFWEQQRLKAGSGSGSKQIELPEVTRLLLIQPGKKASSYASKHALGSALSALFEQHAPHVSLTVGCGTVYY